jgi:hypothetical protein
VITGALILLVGIVIGLVAGRLPARRKDPKPAVAVCGCTHHHSMHDPETGRCNAEVTVPRYNKGGDRIGKDYRPCACLRYSGPEPMPTYYATEIAGEAGQ